MCIERRDYRISIRNVRTTGKTGLRLHFVAALSHGTKQRWMCGTSLILMCAGRSTRRVPKKFGARPWGRPLVTHAYVGKFRTSCSQHANSSRSSLGTGKNVCVTGRRTRHASWQSCQNCRRFYARWTLCVLRSEQGTCIRCLQWEAT
jgi:hypothetical protein